MQEIIRLNDSRWNGRSGYDTYFVSGTRDEVRACYEKRLKPQPQESPSLTLVKEVPAGTELTNYHNEPVTTENDGFKIQINKWAV